MVDGLETHEDLALLEHFEHTSAQILPTLPQKHAPFERALLTMAVQHSPLMHVLLSFATSHAGPPELSPLQERQAFHLRKAREELQMRSQATQQPAPGQGLEMKAREASFSLTLNFCLEGVCNAGIDRESSAAYMDAARYSMTGFAADREREGELALSEFVVDFFMCYGPSAMRDRAAAAAATTTTTTTTTTATTTAMMTMHRPLTVLDPEVIVLPRFIVQRDKEDRTFQGLFEPLMETLSKITQLRQVLRARRAEMPQGTVDYAVVADAVSIDTSLRLWQNPVHRLDSPLHIAAQLYRECAWIYLCRTMNPSSSSSDKLTAAVEEGLGYLRQLPPDAPCQSILLAPVFILSCAAFLRDHRHELRKAFGTLKRYSGLRNIEPAKDAIERLWNIMDAGDEWASWDLEHIIAEGGHDFMTGR